MARRGGGRGPRPRLFGMRRADDRVHRGPSRPLERGHRALTWTGAIVSPPVRTVPTIDLTPWFEGGETTRLDVAAKVDAALREVGFLLVMTGRAGRAQGRCTSAPTVRSATRPWTASGSSPTSTPTA